MDVLKLTIFPGKHVDFFNFRNLSMLAEKHAKFEFYNHEEKLLNAKIVARKGHKALLRPNIFNVISIINII